MTDRDPLESRLDTPFAGHPGSATSPFASPIARAGDASPVHAEALIGEVAGWGLCRATADRFAALKKKPGPVPESWKRVSPSLLRYSDEQTIASVASVFEAIARMDADPSRFEGWGVIAAPRFLGRSTLNLALKRFAAEGVWGVSPHLIPHFALHSVSGTISLALGLHGPNLGLGGGLHSPAEGLATALSWLAPGDLPGVWVVLSGWSPELIPGVEPSATEPECRALALAITRPDRDGPRISATFRPHPPIRGPIDLPRLAETIESRPTPPTLLATDAGGHVQIHLTGGDRP